MAGRGGLCHTVRVPAMSAPSLSDRLALVAADPVLAGHPVVAVDRLQMKILGGFRTQAGAGRFAHMRGLIETARQRERNLLESLRL